MAKVLKPLTREQRIKIYNKAKNLYKKQAALDVEHGYRNATGMCNIMHDAMMELNYASRKLNRTNFPEYISFKPKAGWKENKSYWLTRRIKAGGHTKRIAILTALAAGKSKSK